MNTTEDWREARREAFEEGRRRVGPPPAVEKVEALLAGQLPEAEAQEVREALAFYPELVRVMTRPAVEGETPVLTDVEREADLARIRKRLGFATAPVIEMRPRGGGSRFLALVAGIAIAVTIGGVVVMQRWQREPRNLTRKVLIADGSRSVRGSSSAPAVILAPATDYLLKPLHRPERVHREYRLELLDLGTSPPRAVWKRDGITREADGSFPAELSTDDLAPGDYQLVLYGIDESADRLATYRLRIDVQ
ncbi:MAG: hypothetical protein ACXW5U_20335 [Thermoanaerobaculia bacterium]